MTATLIPLVTTPQETPFRCGTHISEDLFVQELDKKGALTSPLFEGEVDPAGTARRIYQLIRSKGHSAEVFIAIAGREHSYGTNSNSVLHRMRTRSWGNARTIRTPGMAGQIVRDPVRGSTYVRYESVYDSVADLIYRYDDPDFDYQRKGALTIAQTIAVHAPHDDNNDPEGFAWFVVNVVNGLRSRMTPMVPGGDFPLIPFVAADRRHYTPGRTVAWPDKVIWHHTDGWDSINWLTISPHSDVSAHYLANHDGTPRAQLVHHRDTAHTTGAIWNPRALTVEWERKWPDQAPPSGKQYQNLGRLGAQIIITERLRGNPYFAGIPKRDLFMSHRQATGSTTCPGDLDIDVLFEATLLTLSEIDRPTDRPGDGMRFFPETGRYLYGGFRTLWEQIEAVDPHLVMRVAGPPVTDEGYAIINGERRRVQFLVKGVLVWNEHLKDPYDVTFMNRDEWAQIESFEEDRVVA